MTGLKWLYDAIAGRTRGEFAALIARLEAAEAVCANAQYYAEHVGNTSGLQAAEDSIARMKGTASVLAAWRRVAGKE